MSLVSIIIPTYKPLDYIFECFESISLQTCDSSIFEVVVVLNGEKEPYYSNIESALKKNNLKHKLIFTEVKGVSNARNIALDYIESVNSQYVVFLDDDDKLSPSFVEECLSKVQSNVIVVCNTKTFVENTDKTFGDDYLSICFKKNLGQKYDIVHFRSFLSTVCAKFIPLAIIGKTRFDKKFALGEDSLFGFEISNKIEEMILSDENSIYYRRLRLSSASRKKRKKITSILNSLVLCKKYSQLYFMSKRKYHFKFYITRILAEFQYIFRILIHSK